MNVRITTEFWISAYRKRLQLLEIPAFVVKKGDDTGGSILIKLNILDGNAELFHRTLNENLIENGLFFQQRLKQKLITP